MAKNGNYDFGKCIVCGGELHAGKVYCSSECRHLEKFNGIDKYCPLCKMRKNVDDFNKTSGNRTGLQTICRACQIPYAKKRYFEKKDHILKLSAKYRLKLKVDLIKRLGGKCVICGDEDIYHLQIDHINNNGFELKEKNKKYSEKIPGTKRPKRESISPFIQSYFDGRRNINELQVLCANHNAEKHLKRCHRFVELVEEWKNAK